MKLTRLIAIHAIHLCAALFPLTFAEATTVEVRGDIFYHASHKFRRIYGSCAPDVQIEVSTPINPNGLDVWGNFSWSSTSGGCSCSDSDTTMRIYNGSAGVKYTLPVMFQESNLYVGVGVSLSAATLKNRFFCINETFTKCAPGVTTKAGLIRYFGSNFYLNVFFDYLYQPIFYSNRVDIGGLKSGLGIGYAF